MDCLSLLFDIVSVKNVCVSQVHLMWKKMWSVAMVPSVVLPSKVWKC